MRYISYAEQEMCRRRRSLQNGLPEAGCYTVFLIKTDGNPKEMECMELAEFSGIWRCFPLLRPGDA